MMDVMNVEIMRGILKQEPELWYENKFMYPGKPIIKGWNMERYFKGIEIY